MLVTAKQYVCVRHYSQFTRQPTLLVTAVLLC